jgi:tetratricopeptide (TPR) repeat protein
VLGGAGFAAGQGEQRLDEAFLLGVEGEQVAADRLPGGGGGGRVGAGDLEQGAFAGQRRAQLVRCVGGKPPLGVEGGLQPREQPVEGVGEFLELVVGPGQGQPFVQAACGDPPGGGGDRAQRAQYPPGDDPADRDGDHRDGREGDGGGDQQMVPVEGDLRESRVDRRSVSLLLLGEYQQARTYCHRALTLNAVVGNRLVEGNIWDSLGYAEYHLGNLPEAAACYQRALSIARELGDRPSEALALTHLGDIRNATGQLPQAREAWLQALAILEDLQRPDADQVRAKLS